MNEKTLQELMNPDPKKLDLEARYMNARIAVDLSFKYAKDFYLPDRWTDVVKEDGKTTRDYHEYTSEEKISFFIKVARTLKPIIESDLNDTLKVLDVPVATVIETANA